MRALAPMLLCLIGAALGATPAAAAPGYVRYPDVHKGRLVFNTGGDLWTASVNGGPATRLTSHPGEERYPYFSPDGATIAFTGNYDGNGDVYVIPTGGGEPRRLTWHPADDEVVGWLPDGRVLYRSRGLHSHGSYELFAVSPQGGEPERLPVGWASRLAQDPDTGLVALNRMPQDRATWKRYRGGSNQNLWVGDLKKGDLTQVTDFSGMDDFPMWWQGRVVFLSDRGGTADLWSMKPDGSDQKRLTDGGSWDGRYPNQGPDGQIAFTRGGQIHLYDLNTGVEKTLDPDIPGERLATRSRYPYASGSLTWLDLSPDGDRLVMVTRGEVFSVPTEEGVTLPITRGSGARESWASFSPDGKRVVYVTDASGEEAIVTADAWGRGKEVTVMPPGTSGWHFPPVWAPDGKRIAWADQTYTLYVAPADGGEVKVVNQAEQWEITEYTWSPDGRWLAYMKTDRRDYRSVYLYDTKSGKSTRVSGAFSDDHTPAWDPDGRYLYFLSDRSVNPLLGERDFEAILTRTSVPMLVLLRPDVENPFYPKVGAPEAEAPVVKEKQRKKRRREKSEGAEDALKAVEITLDGISDRVVPMPVTPGNYFDLQATSDRLFFLSAQSFGLAGPAAGENASVTMMAFDLEEKEASTFLSDVGAYTLAAKGEKMAVLRGGTVSVIGTGGPPSPDAVAEGAVDLSGMLVELDPQEEWRQIYDEGWRHMRDFYWEPSMAGLDWKAVRDQYATVLPRISTRDELRDLMGELIGELATSHTYLWGGDNGVEVPSVPVGMLGADLVREGDAIKVLRVLRGDTIDNARSPLDQPGSEVRAGEYILAVNQRPIAADRPFLAALEGLADQPVLLTVNSKPSLEGARTVVVTPTSSEARLRYVNQIRRNREYVFNKSGGKLGYIHIPDMSTSGLIEFFTWFFPQLDRQGMVVDVRWNRGGFVSQLLMERLRRQVISFDRSRGGYLSTYPYRSLNGPFVVLLNEHAGSDGDIFPRAVQLEKLAPVIGVRSWGGVIGIRADKRMVDGGMLTQPEFANWYPGEGWAVENHGVDPDIVVQNSPTAVGAGLDPQLDRAIEECLKRVAEHPPLQPDFGPPPKKTREAFKEAEK